MKAENLVHEDSGVRHVAKSGNILFRQRQQHACLLKVANRAPRLPPARARTWLRESRRRYRLPEVFLGLPVLFIDSSIHMKLLAPLDQFRQSEADRAAHHAVMGNLLSLHASIHQRGAAAAHQERVADKLAAPADADGRQIGQARPVLLVVVGQRPSEPQTVRPNAGAACGATCAGRLTPTPRTSQRTWVAEGRHGRGVAKKPSAVAGTA